MPAYGDMLIAFPELLREYEVFKMKPRTHSGYGERYGKRKVQGYWSWRKQSEMGIEGDLRTPNHQAIFWVQDDFLTQKSLIGQTDYVEVDGQVFHTIDDYPFSHEGGFTKCLMRVLAGVTDQQVTNTKVDEVIKNDY